MTTNAAVTNAAIYAPLEQQGKTLQQHGQAIKELATAQHEATKHVVRMNGRVTHVEDRTKAHTQDLGNLQERVSALREKMSGLNARTRAVGAHQGERLREVKQEQAWTRERLWETAKQVGGIVAIVAILVKLYFS